VGNGTHVGHELGDFVGPAPGGDLGEFGEDGIDDFDSGLFLKDAVVAVAGGEPEPGDDGQAIATEHVKFSSWLSQQPWQTMPLEDALGDFLENHIMECVKI
jgi:hypothetical protein